MEIGKTVLKLHKAGIAHRDLKPENVMITKDLELKVIDLGYAKHLSGNQGTGFLRTQLGTPMYMAPEIEEGKLYNGADADVFAFGTMLFVAKAFTYPWERASKRDDGYSAISGDKISNQDFWKKYKR